MAGECYRCAKAGDETWMGAYDFSSPEAGVDEVRTICVDCYWTFWTEFLGGDDDGE